MVTKTVRVCDVCDKELANQKCFICQKDIGMQCASSHYSHTVYLNYLCDECRNKVRAIDAQDVYQRRLDEIIEQSLKFAFQMLIAEEEWRECDNEKGEPSDRHVGNDNRDS